MSKNRVRQAGLLFAVGICSGSALFAQGKPMPPPQVSPVCSEYIDDFAGTGCMRASTDPTIGMLYPLSTDFNLSSLGYVGIGTDTPSHRLHVNGAVQIDSLLFFGDQSDGIWFSPTDNGGPVTPMINMFGGFQQPPAERMVLSHSLALPNWGLAYQDGGAFPNQFIFRRDIGDGVLAVNLGTRNIIVDTDARLAVGTGSPLAALHVVESGPASVFHSTSLGAFSSVVEVRNTSGGSGSLIKAFSGNSLEFRVDDNGDTIVNGDVVCEVLQITGGSDLVEGFETGGEACEPGTVLVIDPDRPGELAPASSAYDMKVAGVVSGAGGINHGIRLGQDGVLDGDTLVAMAGRVYVRCTAENGAIQPGDLLTSSNLEGHAMKATDRERAWGAVIGKAMSPLEEGTGLVLVLVDLQ